MPRKAFIHDLQEASASNGFPGVRDVKPGDDDGNFSCSLMLDGSSGASVDIQVLVSDISAYPEDHEYFIYTTSEDVSRSVTECMEKAQARLGGLEISDMLSQLSDTFQEAINPQARNVSANYDDKKGSDVGMDDYEEDGMDYSDDEYGWSPGSPQSSIYQETPADGEHGSETENNDILCKLSEDLKVAKLAGFRVGYLGNEQSPIVCISCKISKFGISEEAMQAWQVTGEQYLVCLIRYIGRYRTLEQILNEEESLGKSSVDIRVDLCDSYKPTLTSALRCFNQHFDGSASAPAEDTNKSRKPRKMVQSFISKPLNALLNERYIKILRYRHNFGQTWSGAEQFFNDYQGKSVADADPTMSRYLAEDNPASKSTTFSDFLVSDHLTETNGTGACFPLITMQFALRHFVRCTEFCLVCHCKTNYAFEALKPYVCSKNLCLYQYMSLGFGPSLEWEIISQPFVVDLLVSFTYSSAHNHRLFDLPTGLGILVPAALSNTSSGNSANNTRNTASKQNSGHHEVELDGYSRRLKFLGSYTSHPVCVGDWVVFTTRSESNNRFHCRVLDTSIWPVVDISEPFAASPRGTSDMSAVENLLSGGYKKATAVIYDQNFDDLDQAIQRNMITVLLDTLPTVIEMKSYLTSTFKGLQPSLASWKDRISKSALDVLRWVVASNRSCIFQDDPDPVEDLQKSSSHPSNANRVGGVPGYMQFRFAQGAPDKEQRFLQSVAAANAKRQTKYPTLFAWHGSRLCNWHSILREGLHFKERINGRAYGDGVYMSTQFDTSANYLGGHGYGLGSNNAALEVWPRSELSIESAISLNEVVNAPAEFVSKSPHLVVAQLDWIQTRYLFIRSKHNRVENVTHGKSTSPTFYKQDPQYEALGPSRMPVVIPMTAFSQQRRLAMEAQHNNNDTASSAAHTANAANPPQEKKRQKLFAWTDKSIKKLTSADKDSCKMNDDIGNTSDETDSEDLRILVRADEIQNEKQAISSKDGSRQQIQRPPTNKDDKNKRSTRSATKEEKSKARNDTTDFVPGTLDASTLPLLGPPSFANPSGTKSLQRDLRTTLRIQDTQPLHELGWYIDPNLINTVYQWIVEFHSFDSSLPLAKDLKKAGLQSIVLEMRFPQDYPIAPPFVRVIRPRFLGFQQGGGGHVTIGGALCMELLTNSGWSAVSSIESVLLQVRMAISSTDPQPARLMSSQRRGNAMAEEYSSAEAVEAYIRACRMHGWQVPKDFEREARSGWTLTGSSSSSSSAI